MQQFYIAREGAAFGPLTVEETDRLHDEGKLDHTTLVWDQERGSWIPADEHPAIAPIFITSSPSQADTEEPDARRAELDALTARVDEKQRVLVALDTEVERRRKDKALLDEMILSQQKNLDDLAREREALSVDVGKGRQELARLRGELDEIVKTMAERRSRADADEAARQAELKAVEAEIENRRRELTGIGEECDRQASVAETRREENEKLLREIAAGQGVLAGLRQDVEARRGELKAAETDLERRRREMAALAAERERQDAAAVVRRDENERLMKEIAAARTAVEGFRRDVEARQTELKAAEEELARRRRELDELEAERERQDAAAAVRRDENEQLMRRIAAGQEEFKAWVEKQRQESERIEAENAARRREQEKLERDAAERLAAFDREMAARKEALAGLERELAGRRVEAVRAEEESARRREEARLAEAERAELARAVEDLAAKRRLLDEEIAAGEREKAEREAVRRETEALRRDAEALEERLRELNAALDRGEVRRAAVDAEIRLEEERQVALRREVEQLEAQRLEEQEQLGLKVLDSFEDIRVSLAELQAVSRSWSEARDTDAAARTAALRSLEEVLAAVRARESELSGFFEDLRERLAVERVGALTQAELDELTRRVTSAREELKFVTQLCFQESQRLERYQADERRLVESIERLEQKHAELVEGRNCLDDDFAAKSAALVRVNAELRAAEGEVATLKRQQAIHATTIEELRQMRLAAVDAFLEAEERRAAAVSAESQARLRIEELECRARLLQDETFARQKGLEEIAEERRRIAAEIESLTAAKAEERRKLEEALAATRAELEQALAAVKAEAEKRAELQRAGEKIAAEKQELIAACREIEERLATLATEEAQASLRIDSLAGREKMLAEQIAEREAALVPLKEERDRREADLAALRAAWLKQQRENDEALAAAEKALAGRRAELGALEEKLAAIESRRETVGRALAEAESRKEMLAAERNDLTAQNEELVRRIAEAESRLELLGREVSEREAAIGKLRLDGAEQAEFGRRLQAEIELYTRDRAEAQDALDALELRMQSLRVELLALEKERSEAARALVGDLRGLLKAREEDEKSRLDRLIQEYRVEFLAIQEEWANEERYGVSNAELRRLRDEVDEKQREVERAERQLSAMRAGLMKLREENGRNLQQRVQKYETLQLEELKRRIGETRAEAASLEAEWNKELRNAELVERQWIEVKSSAAELPES